MECFAGIRNDKKEQGRINKNNEPLSDESNINKT